MTKYYLFTEHRRGEEPQVAFGTGSYMTPYPFTLRSVKPFFCYKSFVRAEKTAQAWSYLGKYEHEIIEVPKYALALDSGADVR